MIRRLFAHPTARWALTVIALFIVAAIVGPLLVKYPCDAQLDIVKLKNQPPSAEHWFGTDQYSRDLFSRVLCGARISLSVGALAVILSMTIGTAYGLTAGYFGGRVDGFLMRLIDGFLAIPRVLLLLAILALSNVPLWGLIVLLGTTGWFGVSRMVRAETKSAMTQPFIEAARALGASHRDIMFRHLLPNVISPVIVAASLGVGNVIALEAGLSFLGVGVHEPTASWGSIFLEGTGSYADNWWVVLFPGIAIIATVLSFNLLGDALRDVLDPRQVHLARRLPDVIAAENVKDA